MKKKSQKLVVSLRDMKATAKGVRDIEAGKAWPKGFTSRRVTLFQNGDELKALRGKLGYSQSELAGLIQTPTKTYQNWEQGLRKMDGSATILLRLIEANPDVVAMLKNLAQGPLPALRAGAV